MVCNLGLADGFELKLSQKVYNWVLGKVKEFNNCSIYRQKVVQKKTNRGRDLCAYDINII